jgi:hypothetical protein
MTDMNPLLASWHELDILIDFVGKAVEKARKDNHVKNHAESHVNLWIREDQINNDDRLGGIVVAMKLFDWILCCKINGGTFGIFNGALPSYVYTHHDYPHFGAVVLKAEGSKCARCYKISTQVGTHVDCLDVCARCVEVLRKHYPEFLTVTTEGVTNDH